MIPTSACSNLIRVSLAVMLLGMSWAAGPGCQQVGPKATFGRDKAVMETPAPVMLNIQDNDKVGTASGNGPARYTSVTEKQIQTLQTGTVPRDVLIKVGSDGTKQLNLSSGTDISVEGVEYDATSGSFKVKKFGTSASEPIRAGNEAYDRLVVWWKSLSQDQRDVRLQELKTMEAIAPDVRDMLIALLTGL